jgi:hypothetical protein
MTAWGFLALQRRFRDFAAVERHRPGSISMARDPP